MPARWVAADEIYGADPELRRAIRRTGLGYLLQIGSTRWVPTPAGRLRVDRLPGRLPARGWQRRSAGTGSKADRLCSWAWIELSPEPADPADSGRHYLLVRRHHRTGELAYLRCDRPQPATLGELIRVAGQRWRIEEAFPAAKGLTGLDQHQVRRWTSWHRWTILAMLAHAVRAVTAAAEPDANPAPAGLIELTTAELRRLFDGLRLHTPRPPSALLAWSTWRRRHQARARACHHRTRQTKR